MNLLDHFNSRVESFQIKESDLLTETKAYMEGENLHLDYRYARIVCSSVEQVDQSLRFLLCDLGLDATIPNHAKRAQAALFALGLVNTPVNDSSPFWSTPDGLLSLREEDSTVVVYQGDELYVPTDYYDDSLGDLIMNLTRPFRKWLLKSYGIEEPYMLMSVGMNQYTFVEDVLLNTRAPNIEVLKLV